MKKLVLIVLLIISLSFTVYAEEVIPIILGDTVQSYGAPILVGDELSTTESIPSLPDNTLAENASIMPYPQQLNEGEDFGDLQNVSSVKVDDDEKCELVNYGISQINFLNIIREYIKYENLFENNMNYLKVYCIPNVYLDDGKELFAKIPAINPILNKEDGFNLVKDYFSLTAWQGKYDVFYYKTYVRIVHAK